MVQNKNESTLFIARLYDEFNNLLANKPITDSNDQDINDSDDFDIPDSVEKVAIDSMDSGILGSVHQKITLAKMLKTGHSFIIIFLSLFSLIFIRLKSRKMN